MSAGRGSTLARQPTHAGVRGHSGQRRATGLESVGFGRPELDCADSWCAASVSARSKTPCRAVYNFSRCKCRRATSCIWCTARRKVESSKGRIQAGYRHGEAQGGARVMSQQNQQEARAAALQQMPPQLEIEEIYRNGQD